jgi:ATPase subunit of ABC transporter with duplicated ATPase domains
MTSRRGTQALGTKVRSASRALERLDRPEKPFEPWQLQLALNAAARGGDVAVRLERAVVERGAFRLGPLDVELRPGDRLLVAGPNGAGKSTLLGALTGELPLAAGSRTAGRSTVFGTLDQDRALLSGPRPVLDALRAGAATETEARTTLAKFGLRRDDALRPAATLTPGERTRVQLALLVLRRMNVLVLDEPSNHLDLEAVEQLTAALADYPGAAVLVTHDERLRRTFGATQTIRL